MVVYKATLPGAQAKLGEEWLKSVGWCFSKEKSYPPFPCDHLNTDYRLQTRFDTSSSVANTRDFC